MSTRHAIIETPIGSIALVATDTALTGLYFANHWYMPPAATFGEQVQADSDPLLSVVHAQLDEYFAGSRTGFDIPTSTHGDPFQERVWALLGEIPHGQTTTYGGLAARLGDASLAQQVGRAVGRNPLCIIVPCHRVVGKDGKLTGYAGGLKRKQFLLDLEELPSPFAGASANRL